MSTDDRTRRRRARVCALCTVWLTRHPSGLCRECQPIAGTAVLKFSTTIEKENK